MTVLSSEYSNSPRMKLLLLLLLLASSTQGYMIIAYNMNTSQDIQVSSDKWS